MPGLDLLFQLVYLPIQLLERLPQALHQGAKHRRKLVLAVLQNPGKPRDDVPNALRQNNSEFAE